MGIFKLDMPLDSDLRPAEPEGDLDVRSTEPSQGVMEPPRMESPSPTMPSGPPPPPPTTTHDPIESDPLKTLELKPKLIEALSTIYDPEIPVNIYDLGLIYRLDITEDNDIQVDMTLTSPACPVAETLPPMIEQAIKLQIPETKMSVVQVVWEPPWDQSKMSESAKLELGMF